MTDNSYTSYGYDDDAQLTGSLGYTRGGTPIAAQKLGFVYDPGWNMTNRSVNGVPSTYTVNDLNEVTGEPSFTDTWDANGNATKSLETKSCFFVPAGTPLHEVF